MVDISQDKDRVRKFVRSIIRLQTPSQIAKANSSIERKLENLDEWKRAETICIYVSFDLEVDTYSLIIRALQKGRKIVVPRITRDVQLSLHQIRSVDQLSEGAYGIGEPQETVPTVGTSSVDLFIVPGIAFDTKGYRLGRGKGYYDRLLARVSAPKIGLAYAYQIVPGLPHTSYDIQMNAIITEKETIEF